MGRAWRLPLDCALADRLYSSKDHASQKPSPEEAHTVGRSEKGRCRSDRRAEGQYPKTEGQARTARTQNAQEKLKTGRQILECAFCYVQEAIKAIYDLPSPKMRATAAIERYRQGYSCLLIDFNLRPLGGDKPCELTAISYRLGALPKRHGNLASPFNFHMNRLKTEDGWNNQPMLVKDCELVQGSQPKPFPPSYGSIRDFNTRTSFLGNFGCFGPPATAL